MRASHLKGLNNCTISQVSASCVCSELNHILQSAGHRQVGSPHPLLFPALVGPHQGGMTIMLTPGTVVGSIPLPTPVGPSFQPAWLARDAGRGILILFASGFRATSALFLSSLGAAFRHQGSLPIFMISPPAKTRNSCLLRYWGKHRSFQNLCCCFRAL